MEGYQRWNKKQKQRERKQWREKEKPLEVTVRVELVVPEIPLGFMLSESSGRKSSIGEC